MPVFLIMLQVRIKLCWLKFTNLCAKLFPPPSNDVVVVVDRDVNTEEVGAAIARAFPPGNEKPQKVSGKRLKAKRAAAKKKPAKTK